MKKVWGMRTRILILCLGSTLLALVLQTFLFQETSSKLIYDQAKEESFHSLQNMQNDIYSFIKNIENKLIDVYNDKEFIQAIKSDADIEKLRSTFYREAYTIGTKKFDTTDGVVSLYLYTEEHEIISTYRRAVTPIHNYPVDIYEDMEGNNAGLIKDYVNSDQTIMLVSGYNNQYRNTDIVRFVLKLYNNSNVDKGIGYIVCDIDNKVIKSIMDKYSTDKEMFIWLQPMGDRPIVSIGNLTESDSETYQTLQNDIAREENEVDYQSASDRVFFQVNQNRYNLGAYSLMPQALLKQNQQALTKNLILIASIMIIVSTILTIIVSRSLSRPLEKLIDTTERIKKGEIQLRATVDNTYEIGKLGHSFNEMLDQIEDLVSEKYKTELLLNRAEYKALQAQINPHFLYNTLDTMSSISEIQNCHEVSRICQSLSNIFRYSLDMKNPFSTVAKEIAHLKNYIYVMNERMQDNIQYNFDIDESVLQDTLPRISIQPLVENALNHGLRNFKGIKMVTIQARPIDNQLEIIVEDNGVGMEAVVINKLLEENNIELVEKGSSIGIKNINARMKILYGKEYGIHIKSEIGCGTAVTLRIPRVKMEEANEWIQ